MKTCIAIAIRFEETLIVQEHSTLKYGTFLGLKKRGNCTQLLEKTFREGKGPNHFSFFFSPCLFFPDLSRQNFPSILSIKNHSNQPMILDILENPRCSFSTNRYIIASTVSSLSFSSLIAVFLQLRANFSLFWNVYYVFILIPDSASGVETPSVCFPSTDRTLSSSLPSENVSSLFLFVPFTQREHSSSLLIPQ